MGTQIGKDYFDKVCSPEDAKLKLDPGKLSLIHEHIEKRIKEKKIAGAISVVAGENGIVHYDVSGYADIESGKRLEKSSIFRLASMTKPVIGVAVMMLAEQGRLNIDDSLSSFIPEYRNMTVAVPDKDAPEGYKTVPADREIILRDLLTHSSGLGHGGISENKISALMPKDGDTLADVIPRWAAAPLDFQPGTHTGYSGLTAFDVLGRVVEIVSGQPLDKFLSEKLFVPLGMTETAFTLSEPQWKRTVTLYESTDKGLVRTPNQKPLYFSGYFCGAGGLHGTVEDYLRFALMLLNGGEFNGARILKPETIKQMSAPQLPQGLPGIPAGQNWGLSMRVITDSTAPGAILPTGCFGWSGAWGTHFWIDPENKLTALMMINLFNAGGSGALTARELETDVCSALISK
jgi:CubicO group peptidase (beta-lactamase class C family)